MPDVRSTLGGKSGVYRPLFSADGSLNPKLPKTIIEDLGPRTIRAKVSGSQSQTIKARNSALMISYDEVLNKNHEEIDRLIERIRDRNAERETSNENQMESIDEQNARDRNKIKKIFKNRMKKFRSETWQRSSHQTWCTADAHS